MDKATFENLSNEELLKSVKLHRKMKIYDAVIVGVLIGIGIYSTINQGFGLLTFLPLVYIPIVGKNNKRRELLETLAAERGLE
jgi:uncharacterized membrane protein YobD (UPF0266 family)